jgi:hypothetical protein
MFDRRLAGKPEPGPLASGPRRRVAVLSAKAAGDELRRVGHGAPDARLPVYGPNRRSIIGVVDVVGADSAGQMLGIVTLQGLLRIIFSVLPTSD